MHEEHEGYKYIDILQHLFINVYMILKRLTEFFAEGSKGTTESPQKPEKNTQEKEDVIAELKAAISVSKKGEFVCWPKSVKSFLAFDTALKPERDDNQIGKKKFYVVPHALFLIEDRHGETYLFEASALDLQPMFNLSGNEHFRQHVVLAQTWLSKVFPSRRDITEEELQSMYELMLDPSLPTSSQKAEPVSKTEIPSDWRVIEGGKGLGLGSDPEP